jgi:methionine aminopeptidase
MSDDYMDKLNEMIRANKILRKNLDEARDLLARAKLLKRASPGMKIMEVTQAREEWFKAVDKFLEEVK